MSENIFGMLLLLPILVLLTFIQAYTPYLTRKTEQFGVSIPASEFDSEQIKAYRKAYRNANFLVGGITAVILAAFMLMFPAIAPAAIALVFIMLFFNFIIYYKYHKLMKALKQQKNWQQQTITEIAVDVSPTQNNYVSAWWLIVNPIIIAATITISLYLYPTLPDKIPSHYDIAGNIDAYMDKSVMSVLLMPMFQAFLSVIFTFTYFVTKNSRRQIDLENKEESIKRVAVFRKAWGYFNTIAGIGINFAFLLGQLAMFGLVSINLFTAMVLIFAFGAIVGSIILSVVVGQGGSRIKLNQSSGKFISARDDDKYWKLGTFYYNPDDPALFVEKRFGIGWTSNFARPMTYVFIFGLIALVVLILVISLMLS